MSISEWFPGLITWLFNHSSHPELWNLQDNNDQGWALAQQLLELKRQELRGGHEFARFAVTGSRIE